MIDSDNFIKGYIHLKQMQTVLDTWELPALNQMDRSSLDAEMFGANRDY